MLSAVNNTEPVAPDMTPIAQWLGATDPENFLFAFVIMYIIINALSILVFNLGFARKLPVLKNVVIYAVMFFGNIFITFLALSLPIIESLFIAALVLGIYKFQLKRHKNDEQKSEEEHY
ncbi:YlaH-like family protein [Salipaludibacillus aurantiacus]|uniref:YlaH-like protein n=1 Tax=Salipaludibacillus aurantiacus TaxID=1601833 RepID=A0A1H9X0C1_9BACI|nr:YlaH-like family protein [Salipaludibacillus aurantiacus]SES39555.1 YlaH-like protein [Salipaludibacillus aurantiacus]